MDDATKEREKALIDAEVTKEDIATECRRRFPGRNTTRQQVYDVFRGRSRSVDVIELVAADLLGVSRETLWPDA
jgi:hypothetical protein